MVKGVAELSRHLLSVHHVSDLVADAQIWMENGRPPCEHKCLNSDVFLNSLFQLVSELVWEWIHKLLGKHVYSGVGRVVLKLNGQVQASISMSRCGLSNPDAVLLGRTREHLVLLEDEVLSPVGALVHLNLDVLEFVCTETSLQNVVACL